MSTENETTKQRFTCPNCGNNVSAPPEEVAVPVECPHCGQLGQFTPAPPKPGEYPDGPPTTSSPAAPAESASTIDSAAQALAASEFSSDPAPLDPAPASGRQAPPRRKRAAPPRRSGDFTAPRRDRPGYRRHDPRPAAPTKEGISLVTVFLAIVAAVLAVIIIMVMIPRDLSAIKGYPARSLSGSSSANPRNLLAEVQTILGPRDRSLAFTEAEVNAYLNQRVQGIQRGPMKGLVKFKGAYADFEPNRVEFYIDRTVMGIPFTMSLKVAKQRFKHKTTWRAGGGSIGRFGLGSRQFKPIVDAFARLGAACEEEMDAVNMMGNIRFEKDKVILDPNFDGNTPPKAPETPATPEPEPKPEPSTGEGSAMEGEAAPAMEGESMEGGSDTMEESPMEESMGDENASPETPAETRSETAPGNAGDQ